MLILERVTFLHAADLHLGSLLNSGAGNMPRELWEKIREAVYTACVRLVDAALRHKVDFVIFCGDIYDQMERSARAKRFFIDQMERLNIAAVPVYVLYGNHDHLAKQTGYFKYPDNVHIFSADDVERMEVPGSYGRAKARILGQSYGQRWENRKMHLSYTPPNHDLINIGVLHTALKTGQKNYIPCSAEELKSAQDIDYWALGHVHQRRIVHSSYPTIAFPGIPQGRYKDEPGLGGCLLVTLQREKAAELQLIPTSSIVWLECEVPVKTGDLNEDDLVASVTELREQITSNITVPEAGLPWAPGEILPIEGYIINWVFTGRGEIHKLVAGDDAVAPMLVERINREFAGSNPFIWTEGVRFEMSSPFVDLENVPSEDAVLNTLLQVYRQFTADPALRKQVIEKMGASWFEQSDAEDTRDKFFPLNNETYNSIIKNALLLAAERIMEGRGL